MWHICLSLLYFSDDPDKVESMLLEAKDPMSREDLLTLVNNRVSITETISSNKKK